MTTDSDVIRWVITGLALTLGVFGVWSQNRDIQRSLKQQFARQVFNTPQGPVTGESLVVVRKRLKTILINRSGYVLSDVPYGGGDAFWYCVGPGPSYFLAIAVFERSKAKDTVNWIVRPLSEPQMRAAVGFGSTVRRKLADATARFAAPANADA